MKTPLHVVLGWGQVGIQLAEILIARGERVRVVRRSDGPPLPGASPMRGDLSDLRFAEEAMRGASVIYQCAMPAYDRWLADAPALMRGILHGAAKAGASSTDATETDAATRLIMMDNLYMYGRVGPHPIDEDTPSNPVSRKGELRAKIASDLLAAHARGDVRVAIGRAPDFIGPRTPIAVTFPDDFYRRALAGEPVFVLGDPDQPHSYGYTPDIARALIVLGDREESLGKVWHLPVLQPANATTRDLVDRVQQALDAPRRIESLPDATLAELGKQNALLAELVEMTYAYKAPFIVDDRRFRTTFGMEATKVDAAIAETGQWARQTFAPEQAPVR